MDLRVRKTYSALIAACTDLMSDMRFEDITVAMLCDRAMIRRTTFYKHFADKSEFFSFYVDSLRGDMVERGRLAVDELEPGVAHTAFAERAAILDAMADYFLEHETLMENIFSSSTCGMMLVVICEKMAQSFNEKAAHDLRIEAPGPDDLICRCEFAAAVSSAYCFCGGTKRTVALVKMSLCTRATSLTSACWANRQKARRA